VVESEPLRNECQHFIECCLDRRAPRTDGREGLRVLSVLQAAQRSLDDDGESVASSVVTPSLSKDYYLHPRCGGGRGRCYRKGHKDLAFLPCDEGGPKSANAACWVKM